MSKKRKIYVEDRISNEEWETKYLFVVQGERQASFVWKLFRWWNTTCTDISIINTKFASLTLEGRQYCLFGKKKLYQKQCSGENLLYYRWRNRSSRCVPTEWRLLKAFLWQENTTPNRVKELVDQLTAQSYLASSVTVYESTNNTDMMQLSIFICTYLCDQTSGKRCQTSGQKTNKYLKNES